MSDTGRSEPGGPTRVPTFPPIPASPAYDVAPTAGRMIGVPLLAAVVGGVLTAGALLLFLRQPGVVAGDAAPTTTVQQVRAPVIEVDGQPTRIEAVAAAVLPSVVQIDVTGRGLLGTSNGNGSGVIYRSDGHILTNNHVVENADSLEVVFSDGSRADGSVVGRDELSDMAVIKVRRNGLQAVTVGTTDNLRVGQLAVAIGSPFGLEGSVTAGIISALNRPISVGDGIRLPDVIQTDAPINPGNSGGALVGADGRLIGINSAILTSGAQANAGVGFAIPVDIAVDVADQIIASGEVTYAFLGVEGSDVSSDVARRVGVDAGAFVQAVQPGTPAAEAGLRHGDVVVALDGQAVRSMDDLILLIRAAEVGATVELAYVRDGRERTAAVTLTERPE